MAPNVDRPIVSIKVLQEGKGPRIVDFGERLVKFEYVDEERMADKCTLVLDNFDLTFFDDDTFRKGTVLEVSYGYAGRMAPARRAVIHRMRGGRQLTIEAYGMAMVMHKVKRSRVWENKTLAQIATEIAASYGSVFDVPSGASPSNISVEAAYDHPRTRHQASETDATFLTRLARRHGLEFYVDSQGLHFKPRNLAQAPVKEFVWYNGEGNFLDFAIDNDISGRAGSVTKKGLDPLSKKTLSHTAENGTAKRAGLAPVIEIVDPITGKETLQTRTAESHTEHTSEVTDAGVKSHAEGKFRNTQHETIHLNFALVGDPDVLAKRVYKISGLGKRMSGRYYAKTVTHMIEHGRYTTDAKSKTDGHGGYPKNNASSKAAVNKDNASPTEIEVIDPKTGLSHIEFRKKGSEP